MNKRSGYKRSTEKTLRKNFSWTLIGNIIYAASQWGLLIILAKIGTAEMVGIFSLALAITAPILMFTNLQLRSIQATDTEKKFFFGDYLGLRTVTTTISLVIILIFVPFLGYSVEVLVVIIIIAVSKIIESLSDIIYGSLQKREEMDKIAISMILKGIASLLSVSIVLTLTDSLIFSTLALTISWFAILLFYDLKNISLFEIFKPYFIYSKLSELVKLSLPLGFSFLILSLNTNIPRYFIEYFQGIEKLGYFAAMVYITVAGNTIVTALGQSATPRLARSYSEKNIKVFSFLLIKLFSFAFLVGGVTIIVTTVFGAEILTIIYEKSYAKYANVFSVIMFYGLLSYLSSIVGYGITATRTFKIQPYIGGFSLILGTVVGFYLIPLHGLTGAAYTLVTTTLVQVILKLITILYLVMKSRKPSLNKIQ